MQITCMLAVWLTLPGLLPAAAGLRADRTTRLYGAAASLEGKLAFDKGPRWLTISGPGSATWQVASPKQGDYEVAICYAGEAAGAPFEITGGVRPLAGVLPTTEGVFQDAAINFERLAVKPTLRLREGANQIVFRIAGSPGSVVHLRSLELTPVAARAAVAKAAAEARSRRANTDWLARAGYGLMFHWTSRSQPRHGPRKPYAQAVADFDVDAFVNTVAETGAAYVLFSVNHADPHCPAPIKAWERIHPGWTTQRDLISELADRLAKHHVRLMLYFASHTLGRLGKSTSDEYARIHQEIFSEMGARYRDKVSGYWLDGWYQSLEMYPELPVERIWEALKTGNPRRLVALNFWVYPIETEWQDYWAAEVGGLVKPAESRYATRGPGKGLQHHYLLFADAPWVHSKPDSDMEPLRFKDDKLIEFIQATAASQGVVTINLGVFQDGAIGTEARRQMLQVQQAMRGR